ncbi:MAG TPA: PHP domain-containing protein, partial [Niabella sp.]|nr:PHP domain-containing protein [Niabella sp.]
MYLNCKTYFSFLYGTFSTEELVKKAAELGVATLALTNINSTYDTWDFVKLCRAQGIRPVLGAEIRNDRDLLYVLLAANNNGLAWIHTFLSEHLIGKKAFPEKPEQFFTNSWDGFVIFPFGK